MKDNKKVRGRRRRTKGEGGRMVLLPLLLLDHLSLKHVKTTTGTSLAGSACGSNSAGKG